MTDIVTLTMNPAIDVSAAVDRIAPMHKLRCKSARRDPGGGGINVARVARRFGADVTAVYPIGGSVGNLLQRLVVAEGIRSVTVPIAEETREDFTVLEESTGDEYRFVLPGPRLSESEWQDCLNAVVSLRDHPRFFVASGSLPPGVPEDFYVRANQIARQCGAKLIVDTSGLPLQELLKSGAYLIKPNLRELRELLGMPLVDQDLWIAACRQLVKSGAVEVVALTLGDQGALLVTRDQTLRAYAVPVKPVSTVGAGDSFLGGFVATFALGSEIKEAFRCGVASGSAALLAPGTELCRVSDMERLLDDVRIEPV